MANIYGITFSESGSKKEYYKSNEEYALDDLVIVETERGELLAKVVQVMDKKIDTDGKILRKATDEEFNKYLDNLKDAEIARKKCREIAKELELDMGVVSAQYNLDRSQLLFNFTADSRIDFRDLAKKLAGIYHTRIELRQIGARDKAKEVNGIGICGGELCCARFLRTMNTISMNMAKDQNLALNPNKINGSCGRLLCCLQYEDEIYLESSKGMPSMGDIIKTSEGEGPVVNIDVLNRKVKVLIDGEKIDYYVDNQSKK